MVRKQVISAVVLIGGALCLAPPFASASPAAQHLNANAYADWQMGPESSGGSWEVDQDVVIKQKARASFWTTMWDWSDEPGVGGYLGLQTNGNRFNGSVGDTGVFSIWGSDGGRGSQCQPFAPESGGGGYSCRIAFSIKTNRFYKLRVWRLDADSTGQWWGGWIIDTATGKESPLGALHVAASHTLLGSVSNFSEYFGTAVPCNRVPKSTVVWTQPAADYRGGGRYEAIATYAGSSRGSCTRGSVTSVDLGWTRGARIVLGGSS